MIYGLGLDKIYSLKSSSGGSLKFAFGKFKQYIFFEQQKFLNYLIFEFLKTCQDILTGQV